MFQSPFSKKGKERDYDVSEHKNKKGLKATDEEMEAFLKNGGKIKKLPSQEPPKKYMKLRGSKKKYSNPMRYHRGKGE